MWIINHVDKSHLQEHLIESATMSKRPKASTSCSDKDKELHLRPERYNKSLKLSEQSTTSSTDVTVDNECQSDVTKTSEFDSFEVDDCARETCARETKHDTEQNYEFSMEELLSEVLYHHEIDKSDSECTADCDEFNERCLSDSDDADSEIYADPTQCAEKDKETSDDDPIYYGHSMPVRVSLLLILIYSITHSISECQLKDLLTLIGLHCLEIHPGLKSIFHFKQYFANLKSPLVKHYYCLYCLTCVDRNASKCPNKHCLKDISEAKSKSYFIEVPIEDQIKNLFKRDNFAESLAHRFKRKTSDGVIGDIYDGNVYKKMSENKGPLSEEYPYNLSFTLNTDGIPIFKSSKFSIWPVYLMINELPFKVRKQSENMIFCGLWFGDCKPFMATFTRPIHASLKTLEDDGIPVTVNDKTVTCKAYLLCATADLPARSLLMNMTQYNGAYSCSHCLQRGSTYQTAKGGSVHTFPFDPQLPRGEERTHEGSIKDAKEALSSGASVNGVKGPSFLLCLKSFDFVKCSTIDYMHGILLGLTKLLINLWMTGVHSKEEFSLSEYSHIIDSRLLEIKPPSFITRVPRAISTHFKYWKASELRSWLLFYSLPILQDLMHETYYIHYSAFVQAIFCLCGTCITPAMLKQSEQLLMYFVMSFDKLYGERYLTLNLHALLHLTDCVRNLGPLWAHSCFSFESANGDLTKFFHGTQHVDMQILASVNILQMLPSMMSSVSSGYQDALLKLCPPKFSKRISHFHIQFLGKGFERALSNREYDQIYTAISQEPLNIIFYNRVMLRGVMYHSIDYERVTKRNNYTVQYYCPETKLMCFGYVRFFGSHSGLICKSFAFIKPLKEKGSILDSFSGNRIGINLPHLHVCEDSDAVVVVELENVFKICVNIEFKNSKVKYICETANDKETD